ncbi:MAG: glycerate kinase type-2 family protein [Longimicrobiales bacterium]
MDLDTLRRHAEDIFQAGLKAADAGEAVAHQLSVEGGRLLVGGEPYSLGGRGRIRVVGMGKASAAMAGPLEEALGDRLDSGLLLVKYGHGLPLRRIRVLEAGHPIPDERGEKGTIALLRLLDGGEPDDLVFCLISGGGSALSPAPAPGITLEEKGAVTRLLLGSGATIHQVNTIRKHLSRIKGGRLAQRAHPARIVSLILSDVVGDDLATIASGPTVPDVGTFRDCLRILEEREIRNRAPLSVLAYLESGARGEVPETPKPGDPTLATVRNLIVGSNRMALEAAGKRAKDLGYETLLLSGLEEGEAKEVALAHVALARRILEGREGVSRPACILTGGETTVTIQGPGKGGRNQEFALAAAVELAGTDEVVVLSAGTDGTDGPTDAAGAVADNTSVARGRAAGMDARAFLDRNDSYHFFRPLGDLLKTGPTFTNVMDLRIVLVS